MLENREAFLRLELCSDAWLAEIRSMSCRYWVGGDIRSNCSSWNWDYLDEGIDRIVASGGHIAGVVSPPNKNRGYLINDDEKRDPEAWLAG